MTKSKKMKLKSAITLLGIGALIVAFTPEYHTEKIEIDTKASKLEWTAEKVTGKHSGLVPLQSGNLEMDHGKLVGGTFIANMDELMVTDLDGGMKEKLEGHLKSADFFAVEEFKSAKLVFTNVEYKDSEGGFNTMITGNLTIKGITHPITFPARVKMEAGALAAYAELKVDRTKYDVHYGSASFFDNLGDKAIYDEFMLRVSLGGMK